MSEGRKTSSLIYKNILPLVKEHLDEGRCCSHGAARFGFRKEVKAVFLVVTQLNGGEGGRGEVVKPAWLKIKKFRTSKKKITETTTTSWSLFTMPGICPEAPGG